VINGVSLAEILERHLHWIREDCEGWENMRADLSEANLRGADLRGADLRGADLSEANLSRANLFGADLSGAENVPFIPMACPDTGSFIGWKKSIESRIVQLEVPADAKRSSATGRKCRCDKAKVISITNIEGDKNFAEAYSWNNSNFVYKVGEMVSVEDFCEDRFRECAPGIHFFVNRQEAVNYDFC